MWQSSDANITNYINIYYLLDGKYKYVMAQFDTDDNDNDTTQKKFF